MENVSERNLQLAGLELGCEYPPIGDEFSVIQTRVDAAVSTGEQEEVNTTKIALKLFMRQAEIDGLQDTGDKLADLLKLARL